MTTKLTWYILVGKNMIWNFMKMDAFLADNCTLGWHTFPLWGFSKQPPSTLVFQFGSLRTLMTSPKVLNMLKLMTNHNGIIRRSNFRKVKILILAHFLVFSIFDLVIVVRSFNNASHPNRNKILHPQAPLKILYY